MRKSNKYKKKKEKLFVKTRFFFKFILFASAILGFIVAFQLINKPTEVIGFVFGSKQKSIYKTWKDYKPLFKEHSTNIIKPKFLAAMAQVESGGNPLASPSWRFEFTKNFWNLFSPQSSSVGLFQFTTPTFKKASKLCIHRGNVVKQGKWYNIKSCWFNGLYYRLIPSHSIEVASAYLHHGVRKVVRRFRLNTLSEVKAEKLAAVIHLCGIGRAKKLIKNNFNLRRMQKCGSHNVNRYYSKILSLKNKI